MCFAPPPSVTSPLANDPNIACIANAAFDCPQCGAPPGWPQRGTVNTTTSSPVGYYTAANAAVVAATIADHMDYLGYRRGLGSAFNGTYGGGISIQNFGHANGNHGGRSIHYDPRDFTGGIAGPFFANAILRNQGTLADGGLTLGDYAKALFVALKAELDARNLCYPAYLTQDMEALMDFGAQPGGWWFSARVDPRYTTETLYREWNGSTWTNKTLQDAWIAAGSPDSSNSQFFFQGINQAFTQKMAPYLWRMMDYALSKVLYEPAREVFPNILCGNYEYSMSTTSSQTSQFWEYQNIWYRWPVSDFPIKRYLEADFQIPVCYGPVIQPGRYWTDNYLPPPVPDGSGAHIFGSTQQAIHTNWCIQRATTCSVRNAQLNFPYLDEPLGLSTTNTEDALFDILKGQYNAGIRKWHWFNQSGASTQQPILNVVNRFRTWVTTQTRTPRVRLATAPDANVGYARPDMYLQSNFYRLDRSNPSAPHVFLSNFDHPVFDDPKVVPYTLLGDMRELPIYPTYGAYPNTPYGLGQSHGDTLDVIRDKFLLKRPSRTFRWAYCPQGFGSTDFQANPSGLNPYGLYGITRHPSDWFYSSIDGQIRSPWSTNSVAQWRAFSLSYFAGLKNRLDYHGLPSPVYLDPDYESQQPSIFSSGSYTNPAAALQTLTDLKADPRYYTDLFDGHRTMHQLVSTLTDLDGTPIPENQSFCTYYGLSPDLAKRANIYVSVGMAGIDWILWKTLYEPAKMILGSGVICGNYNVWPASRGNEAFTTRFKESPVDFNSGQWSDVGVLSMYGPGGGLDTAQPTWATDWGIYQYYEIVDRYNLPSVGGSYTADDQFRDLFLANHEFNARSIVNARASGKQSSFWISYDQGAVDGTICLDSSYWPTGGACYTHTLQNSLDLFKIYGKYNLEHIGFFEASLNPTAAWDHWGEVISNLHRAGYRRG
jgi:hypothetical protein